jgi:hypothetical protein
MLEDAIEHDLDTASQGAEPSNAVDKTVNDKM